MNLRCLLTGHKTVVRYTPLEGQVSCSRCGTVTEVWKVLRPEQVAQELRRQQQFWARIDARREQQTRSGLRLVR
jgi:hypothetical protein